MYNCKIRGMPGVGCEREPGLVGLMNLQYPSEFFYTKILKKIVLLASNAQFKVCIHSENTFTCISSGKNHAEIKHVPPGWSAH